MKSTICYSLIIAAVCSFHAAASDNLHKSHPENNSVKSFSTLAGQTEKKSLPRGKAPESLQKSMPEYVKAIQDAKVNMHSIMVVQHGKVIAEQWFGEGKPDVPHILNSVSKSFTSTAVGFAVAEGKLKVTDKVISFFPDKLPAEVSDNLKAMEIRHLLTMTCGHDSDPSSSIREAEGADWIKAFLAYPVQHKPGEYFQYNSLGTYMLSAIVQKVTGQKVLDYLTPRLFQPLGIEGATWQESPQGINCGGWGLYLKTEDLAKMGQFLLQKGKWEGKQLLPKEWVETATSAVVPSSPSWVRFDEVAQKLDPETCDWVHGYGYQFWQCRHNCYRADGANGQYIIVIPEKDAVVAATADLQDMQQELDLIWQYILPALD